MSVALVSNSATQAAVHKPAPQVAAPQGALCAMITQDPEDIRKAFELRYRIFAEEMGAEMQEQGIDKDRFDDVCHHLIVKDEDSGAIVGYSRIITNNAAEQAGSFYTQTEFDLSNVLVPGKTYMEIGRTCVDSTFRSGAVIALLWARLGQFMMENQIDYLMGCASIPLSIDKGESAPAMAIINYLREKHFTDENQRVYPKHPLPKLDTDLNGKDLVPALLKAYLRIGCKVCGEPHWDKDFNVADVVVLLDRQNINMRYLKHFLRAS